MHACHDVLELDDEIFMTVGSYIGTYNFTGAGSYLQSSDLAE